MLIPLELPPGAFRNGTNYQASGRFYDVNRVRWFGKALGPIGGWREKTTSTASGKARAIIAWRDNSNAAWAAFGTNTKLYSMTHAGLVTEITPVGFTTSSAEDSDTGSGYGLGTYGTGPYGTPRPDDTDVQPAALWTLDTRGEDLVGRHGSQQRRLHLVARRSERSGAHRRARRRRGVRHG
jgi:hypothetical protein